MKNSIKSLVNSNQQNFSLYELRKNRWFTEFISPAIDFSLSTKIDGIPWKVWVKFSRNISWVFNVPTSRDKSFINLFLAINKVIKPKIFYDIGANIGFFSWLLLANKTEDLQTVLFEPDPDNIRLLTKTIKEAELTSAKIIASAVSDQNGRADFATDKITGATGTLETQEKTFIERQYGSKNRELINVNTVTLDYLTEEKIIPYPDLIKIDVECSEHKVLMGANNVIRSYQPIIIFECSQNNKKNLLNYLQELGYLIYNADNLDGDIWQAANILAISSKYHSYISEIFSECTHNNQSSQSTKYARNFAE